MKSQTIPYRIAVFTPHIDGEYFGKILSTISMVTRAKQSQLTIIHTQINHPYDDPIEHPVFVDEFDACIIILEGVAPATARLIAQSGKPVVSIGHIQSEIDCHSVLIDNLNGTKEAVLHLIDHGHRDIAFVSFFDQQDQHERFSAYKEALAERNIPYNPQLVCYISDNLQGGGAEAVPMLLERKQHFTAAATSTDRNAMGFLSAWRELHQGANRDIPIVGFDDIEQASYDSISLTTVKQSHEQLALVACNKLYSLLNGETSEERITRVPTSLIIRKSCGCRNDTDEARNESLAQYEKTIEELRSSLRKLEFNNYELIQGLIRVTSDEKIDLSKLLISTSTHWGYLALWDQDSSQKQELIIDRVFSKKGCSVPKVGDRVAVTSFPLASQFPDTTTGGGADIILVHPIQSEKYDWGFLVLAGPLETLHHLFINDLGRHTYTILAAALEREFLFKRIRSIAERLEIVSETTNDGIWDWNIVANKVEYNFRIYTMLGSMAEDLTDDPQDLLNLIHPDDLEPFRKGIYDHANQGTPFQLEFRIRQSNNDSYLWLYTTGEALRDENGKAVRMIGSFTDITKRKADEERIIRLAYHDTLTGLPNRLLFMERLEESMKQCEQHHNKLAVVMIDLDRFKFINDTLGHQAGDKLLQHIADILHKSVRSSDTIARLGGDEFILLLSPVNHLTEIEAIVDHIIARISQPLELEGQEMFTSASIGVCMYPDHGTDVDTLIKYADMAMYKAKENGRNQMIVYTEELSSKVKQNFNLGVNLRKAIERNEFSLHYQPQVDLRSGHVIGTEALLRWNSPEFGMIPPGDFIPYAEETGLIVPISKWVLKEACLQLMEWQSKGFPTLVMSVNISAQHFRSAGFSKWIKSVLDETGVDPNLLCLEITETTAIQDMDHSVQMLKEIVHLGLYIAIDDFGTGYSSLVLLKRLPIHMVKIDKSFIRDMSADQDDAAIVKAVIAMSHSLGLSVIAEGVEGKEQLEQLKLLGCDYIQGFYMGRPMPNDQFAAFIRSYSKDAIL